MCPQSHNDTGRQGNSSICHQRSTALHRQCKHCLIVPSSDKGLPWPIIQHRGGLPAQRLKGLQAAMGLQVPYFDDTICCQAYHLVARHTGRSVSTSGGGDYKCPTDSSTAKHNQSTITVEIDCGCMVHIPPPAHCQSPLHTASLQCNKDTLLAYLVCGVMTVHTDDRRSMPSQFAHTALGVCTPHEELSFHTPAHKHAIGTVQTHCDDPRTARGG